MAKNGNGRINNLQRKVLANLAVEILDKKVRQARDESGSLAADIRAKVRDELGVAAIDMEIADMERKISALQRKKEEIGFSKYNNDALIHGSQAKALVDSRTEEYCGRIRQLEDKKTEVISRIWTSTAMEEALAVLEEARGI